MSNEACGLLFGFLSLFVIGLSSHEYFGFYAGLRFLL